MHFIHVASSSACRRLSPTTISISGSSLIFPANWLFQHTSTTRPYANTQSPTTFTRSQNRRFFFRKGNRFQNEGLKAPLWSIFFAVLLLPRVVTENEADLLGLPEEDEETDCFLCNTNRKGPCRSFWRPLEYCVKQEHGKDDDEEDSECDKYVKPFENCWSRHAALYLLISHSVTEERDVCKIERDYTKKIRSSFKPVIDWTTYEDLLGRQEAWRDAQMRNSGSISNNDTDPLWRQFEKAQVEPILVNITAQVPVHYAMSDDPGVHASCTLTLRAAYAVDQNGHVMGFVEHYAPKEPTDKKNTPLSDKKMLITILPGYTKNFRIKSLYVGEQYSSLVSTKRIMVKRQSCRKS